MILHTHSDDAVDHLFEIFYPLSHGLHFSQETH